MTWEIVDHNLAGSLHWTDGIGEKSTLKWEEASCDPITETKDRRHCEEKCERFIIVKITDDGCPQLSDEHCIDFSVWDYCCW